MVFSKDIIFKSFIWKLLERFSVQGISFIVTIVLARILMPTDYGHIALVMVFINLANVIVDGGLNQALIQKKEADNKDFSTIFHVSMIISFFLYGVMFIAAPAIADFYGISGLVPVIRVLSLSLPLYSFNSIQRAYISRHLLFKSLFKSSLIAVVASGLIGILMALKGLGIWALVFSVLSSTLFTTIAMWFTVNWRPNFIFSKDAFNRLFSFGWKLFLTNFMNSLFVNIRSLVIGKVYSSAMLAYFDRGKQFPTLIMENINASLQTVLFPVFSAEQENREHIRLMVKRSIKLSSFIIFPLMVGMFVAAKPLVIALLTEKWIAIVPFVRIFSVAFMLMPMQIANMEAVKSLGHSGTILKLEMIKKILEVGILIYSLTIDVYAVATGVVVYNFICIFINLYPNIKLLNYKVKDQVKDILPNLSLSIGMGFFIYWIQYMQISAVLILLLQILIGFLVYIVLCCFFRVESFYYTINTLKNNI